MPDTETGRNQTKDSGVKSSWLSIPWNIAGRIGFLFAALCFLKFWKLTVFRTHLFEVHFRISGEGFDWLNVAAFYLFVILVFFNLRQFAARCAPHGVKTIRVANILILAGGTAFVLLTLKFNNNDIIYPLFNYTLSLWDLRWYVNQSLFFQQPYLAAWIFAYISVYYILARTGREHLVLYATAIFGTVYLALNLRDLEICRTALLTADCLGIACLVASTGTLSKGNWLCVILPWLWFVFLLVIFQTPLHRVLFDDPIAGPLWGLSILFFVCLSLVAWRKGFAGAWFWLMAFAFTSCLLLVNINFPSALNYQNLLFVGLTLPRYFFGTFFITGILLLIAMLYRHWLPKGSLIWLDVINVALLINSIIDLRMIQIMRVRLDWQAIRFGADPKMVFKLAAPYLPMLFFGLILMIILYVVFIGLWRRETSKKSICLGGGTRYFLIVFLLLGFTGRWFAARDKAEPQATLLLLASSPLFGKYNKPAIDEASAVLTIKRLGETTMLSTPPAPEHAPRNLNVVMIFQESTYNKYLSLFGGTNNTNPLLAKYTNNMELFPNFFSDFAGSIFARFATFTSLYPIRNYENFTYERVNVKSIFEILAKNGYENSVFDSAHIDYTGFGDFLANRGVRFIYDADNMPEKIPGVSVSWGIPESETLRAIQSQIGQYATNHKKFFLTYIPVAPHNPFDGVPKEFKKFPIQKMGDYTPAFQNDLLYMDFVIASILDELKKTGLLENTLVIITADHGEMLGENGGPVGHGWAITPTLANVPLIIMDPANKGYRINDTIGSQVDVLPTMLDLLGIQTPTNELYQGISLYSSRAQMDRTIYINSLLQYGIVRGHTFITGSGENENTEMKMRQTFSITNDGTKTFFPEIEVNPASVEIIPSITKFEQFQESLLQNYDYYRRSIKKDDQ